jgi:hypothetical protein
LAVKAHQKNMSPRSLAKWKLYVKSKHIGRHKPNDDAKKRISNSLINHYKKHKQSDQTKDLRSNSRRKYGHGLPRYVGVRQYENGPVYVIGKHPKIKYKQFTSLEECLSFLFILDNATDIRKIISNIKEYMCSSKKSSDALEKINNDMIEKLRNIEKLIDDFRQHMTDLILS